MNDLPAVTDLLRHVTLNDPLLQPRSEKIGLLSLLRKDLLSSNPAPLALSLSILPDSETKISQFKERFAPHISKISEKSWKALSKELGEKMKEPLPQTTTSLEAFRDDANNIVNEVTEAIGNLLDLAKVSWFCCGTVGYKSDVDITVSSRSLEEAVYYKVLRHFVHKEIFGGLSGEQLDTECYIPHSAEIDLEQYLLYPNPHMQFLTGEKAAICFQAYMSLGNRKELYETYKLRDLNSIFDEREKEVMCRLYNQVEAAMSLIEKRETNSLLIVLAEEYTRLEKKISSTFQVADVNTLHLEQQRCLTLIAALQKEGTVSVAEGKATILKDGGQKHSQDVKRRTSSFTEFTHCNKEIIDAIQNDPRFQRKFSAPLTSQLERQSSASKELALRIYGADVEKYLRPKYEKPDGATCLLAAYEESWQLIHIVHQNLEDNVKPEEVAVAMGKYAHRITKNLLRAVDELKASGFLRKAIHLEQKCRSLEMCMRANRINSHAAKILLYEEILDTQQGRGSLNCDDIKVMLDGVFKIFDLKGSHYDKLLDKESHLKILKKSLREIKSLWINPKHNTIYPILKGHAGFVVPAELLEKAKEATICHFELTTREQVLQFLDEILIFGQDLRNWARKQGFLAHSNEEMASFYTFTSLVTNEAF